MKREAHSVQTPLKHGSGGGGGGGDLPSVCRAVPLTSLVPRREFYCLKPWENSEYTMVWSGGPHSKIIHNKTCGGTKKRMG